MTDEEQLIWTRIQEAPGEAYAVGEVDLCQLLWPLVTAANLAADGGDRSRAMLALRRRIRQIVSDLRFDWSKPILDSRDGYFVTDDPDEIGRFCHARHKRGITSLVIESIVRKRSPVTVGVQRFLDFLKSEETRRRNVAERTGETFEPIDTGGVLSAVAEGVKTLTAEEETA